MKSELQLGIIYYLIGKILEKMNNNLIKEIED